MLRKDCQFQFKELQQIEIEQLKAALVRKPVLQLYDHGLTTEIHTDASKLEFGAVMLQRNQYNHLFHPVMYMSRKT